MDCTGKSICIEKNFQNSSPKKSWKEHISSLQLNLVIPDNTVNDFQISPNSVLAPIELSDNSALESPSNYNCKEEILNTIPYKTNPLFDEYILTTKELGRGRFGIVRKCINYTSGTVYACKSVSKEKAIQDASKARSLKAEVDATMTVSGHPNVIKYKEIFEDAQSIHYIMELCHGKDLFTLLMEKKRLTEEEAAQTFQQVVRGVEHCHKAGVVHRDIKPENIMLQETTEGKVPKIGDFGHAIVLGPGETAKGIVGSPAYMAPEVIFGVPYTFSADVWSLGIVLYVMLSGLLPYLGKTSVETFKTILTHKPNLVSAPWNEVSEPAKSLIKRLLSRNPEARPSASEILSDPWLKQQVFLATLRYMAIKNERNRSIDSKVKTATEHLKGIEGNGEAQK